jgi:hypothetical protein
MPVVGEVGRYGHSRGDRVQNSREVSPEVVDPIEVVDATVSHSTAILADDVLREVVPRLQIVEQLAE